MPAVPCRGWSGFAVLGPAVTLAGGSPANDPCGIRSRLFSAPFFTP